jgi:RNA polymerase sigma-70 factor, ECF subfamily
VNETMSRAVAGIDRFEWGPAGFEGWVFGIARRATADYHRGTARYRRQQEAADRIGGNGVSPDVEPGDNLILDEDRAAVRQLFELLTPPEKELLELRIIAGLSAEQVAAVLGKRPGAIRTAQSRALAHLRRLMEASQ